MLAAAGVVHASGVMASAVAAAAVVLVAPQTCAYMCTHKRIQVSSLSALEKAGNDSGNGSCDVVAKEPAVAVMAAR